MLVLTLSVLQKNHTDQEIAIVILQILKDMVRLVHRLNEKETQTKFLRAIDGFWKIITVKKHCGPRTVVKFIECLAEIARFDLEGNWAFSKREENRLIFEDIFLFLKHPYHEVRLAAAQHVGLFFVASSQVNEETINYQRRVLDKLSGILADNNRLLLADMTDALAFEYAKYVTVSIALISWAHVICLSPYWRKQALFYLLKLTFQNKFNSRKYCLR